MLDAVAAAIDRAVRPHREPMRRIFAALAPLEALALLGYNVADTIARCPPADRADILAAFCNALRQPDA